jgi:pilus assembly protein TadC
VPTLKYELDSAEIDVDADHYITASFFSALVYAFLFFCLFFALLFAKTKGFLAINLGYSFIAGLSGFMVFMILHLFYPKLMAQKIAQETEVGLIFVLRNILIMVSSGISLYGALSNVAKSKQGKISEELSEVVKDVNAGISEIKALEKMAVKTKSELLKKFSWQLINSLNSGAPIGGALKTVLETATNTQRRSIKNYAAELNLWILFYLLMAAALPTLGIIVLVIFSSIGGNSVGISHLLGLVGVSIVTQIALIGFVKSRIPRVYL